MPKQESINPEDKMVIFKLNDMIYPTAGRLNEKEKYVYIHRADGVILAKYSFGFRVLKIIEDKELIQQSIENF